MKITKYNKKASDEDHKLQHKNASNEDHKVQYKKASDEDYKVQYKSISNESQKVQPKKHKRRTAPKKEPCSLYIGHIKLRQQN